MVSGLLLLVEMIGFMQSGWTAEKFAQPEQAIIVLRDGGHWLRMAAAAGTINLAAMALFLAGLSLGLRRGAPTLAVCIFVLGLLGIGAHSLVPVGLWIAVPSLVGSPDPRLALSAWPAFNLVSSTAHAAGSLFMGAAMMAAGAAVLKSPVRARIAGSLTLAAGLLTVAPMLLLGQLSAASMGLVFPASLAMAVLFRLAIGGLLFSRAAAWAA